MKKLAISGALIFALSGLTSIEATANGGPGVMDAVSTITAAEAAIKKAKSAGGEWRDSSSKFVKQAKAAADKGDAAMAMKLAKKAKAEGELGYQQAMSQKNAGPWLF